MTTHNTVLRQLVAICLGVSAITWSQVFGAQGTGPMTVGRLLHEEELAMVAHQKVANSTVHTTSFELLGIWGVAPVLAARIKYRGGTVDFLQGRKNALEPHQRRFSLLAIKPPCVLFKYQNTPRKTCLRSVKP